MATGYERWTRASATMGADLVRETAKDKKRSKQVGASITNILVGDPELAVDMPANMTPAMDFQIRLFWGFAEISKSVAVLEDIQRYISVFPYARYKIKRSSHLAYHYEHYLHEAFLLRERLTKHAKMIARAYRQDARRASVEKVMSALEEFVERALKKIADVRSSHVHQRRYEHPDIDRLSLFDLIEQTPPLNDALGDIPQTFFKSEYRQLRKRWVKIVRDNNQYVKEMMDAYGEELVKAIYTGPDDALTPPDPYTPPVARKPKTK